MNLKSDMWNAEAPADFPELPNLTLRLQAQLLGARCKACFSRSLKLPPALTSRNFVLIFFSKSLGGYLVQNIRAVAEVRSADYRTGSTGGCTIAVCVPAFLKRIFDFVRLLSRKVNKLQKVKCTKRQTSSSCERSKSVFVYPFMFEVPLDGAVFVGKIVL